MNLKDIDLNLLLVFDELRRHRRMSATAAALGLSQPGVSNALNRLRRLLGDELFLRTPHGMSPTPYADSIAAGITDALDTLRQTLGHRAQFDPHNDQATFTLALTDVGELYFLPALMQSIATTPHITFQSQRSTDIDLKAEMERGRVDLALGFLPTLQAGFMQRRLFQQHYVCLFRQDHPFHRQGIDRASFEAAEHVQVSAPGTGHSLVDETLRQAGLQRRVRLRVPHFMALAQVLQATQMVAVVPERFADRVCGPFQLSRAPCPIALPQSAIHAIWHTQKHRDPAHQWLRQQIFHLFADRDTP